ncbi:MAG: hypothetical protein KatS3mg045_0284 [Bellilinea sp.]|nr:MAG: hypothetical protein KatS3mg045_0284 [Bellilinea sp.]
MVPFRLTKIGLFHFSFVILIALGLLALDAQYPVQGNELHTPTTNVGVMSSSLPGARFLHTATVTNITDNYTVIDHPFLNNNPNAVFIVTPNWNPGGIGGTYNDHPIGVWYNTLTGKWSIFNQDLAAMPDGADFNVLIPPQDADVFVQTATTANIAGNLTFIDHPLLNDNPNAVFFVTPNWNPGGGTTGTYNNHAIGVYYDNLVGQWSIFNQESAAMPVGADFNVLIPPQGANVFVHTATTANIAAHVTYIDHPLLNDNPDAVILVTPNWNPGDSSGKYHNHHIGVWYDGVVDKWAIFNQDLATMEAGVDFNVLVLNDLTALPAENAAFTHTSAVGNITENWTTLDHGLANNNPSALVFTTPKWNGTYNNHAIGVWYYNGADKWAIFNQDFLATMVAGVDFNVFIVTRRVYLPMILR